MVRHEDIPLPESFAETYHGAGEVATKLFIPGQNLNGVMIPSTGEYNAQSQASLAEKDVMVEQFNALITKQMARKIPDKKCHEGFELVSSEDQIVCVQSSDSTNNHAEECMIKRLSSRTIQTALNSQDMQRNNEIQEAQTKQKPKWVFSASIHLSLTKEIPTEDGGMNMPLLDSNRRGQHMIEDGAANTVEEEGVEVVPYPSEGNESNSRDDDLVSSDKCAVNDHISVLYLKENGCSLADID